MMALTKHHIEDPVFCKSHQASECAVSCAWQCVRVCALCVFHLRLQILSNTIIIYLNFITKGNKTVLKTGKNATVNFKNHMASSCHCQAVEAVVTLPAATQDIGKQLFRQHSAQKVKNWQALYQILSSMKF